MTTDNPLKAPSRDLQHWSDRGWAKNTIFMFRLGSFFAVILGVERYINEAPERALQREITHETLDEFKMAQEERIANSLARAWNLVTTSAPGNSGKKGALEFLHEHGDVLIGIDLSCERMQGKWNVESGFCAQPVYLNGVDLHGADLRFADLSGALLWESDFSDTDFQQANLSGVQLLHANLSNTIFWSSDLRHADLSDAFISGADFNNANLSGAHLRNLWAWADARPRGLDDVEYWHCDRPAEAIEILVRPATGCTYF